MSAHNPLQSPGYSQVLRSTPLPATALDRHLKSWRYTRYTVPESVERVNRDGMTTDHYLSPRTHPHNTHRCMLGEKNPSYLRAVPPGPTRRLAWRCATGREGGERKGCTFGVIRCYLRQGTDMSKKDRTYSPSGELMKQVNETENS